MNLTSDQVNLAFIKLKSDANSTILGQIESIIFNTLGSNFSYLQMDLIFTENLDFISNLNIFPSILIVIMSAVSIISLYNYQKGGIMEKVKDFLVMRAIGSKAKSIMKILYLEALYIIIPSLGLSLGVGMILNSIILFDRVFLPNIIIPILYIVFLLFIFGIFNFLSLFPIMKKLNKFTVKDFEMY
jgi:ABC-type antimicrobial peptide transport system permease subunit